MSDIFREVEEDVRRERFEKLWKAYGSYAIVLLALAFAALGGWELWQRHQAQLRDKAAMDFQAAQRISNPRDAANAFSDLKGNLPGGYSALAKLSQANAMLAANQQGNAIDLYKQIAAEDSSAVGAVARLRAGWALAGTGTRSDVATLLAPIDTTGSPWKPLADEILAYADYRALDLKAAAAKYTALQDVADAPESLRARARAMAAFLKNGGAVAYGTVPPDATPASPGGAPAGADAAQPPAPAAPAK